MSTECNIVFLYHEVTINHSNFVLLMKSTPGFLKSRSLNCPCFCNFAMATTSWLETVKDAKKTSLIQDGTCCFIEHSHVFVIFTPLYSKSSLYTSIVELFLSTWNHRQLLLVLSCKCGRYEFSIPRGICSCFNLQCRSNLRFVSVKRMSVKTQVNIVAYCTPLPMKHSISASLREGRVSLRTIIR